MATKTYIDVAYTDRELAKRLGARWDASVKRWYCPSNSTLALIYKWRKTPTPAEIAVDAPAPTAMEAAAASVTAPATAPATAKASVKAPAQDTPHRKVVKARISRMPRKSAPVPASNDLFANLDLPLAG